MQRTPSKNLQPPPLPNHQNFHLLIELLLMQRDCGPVYNSAEDGSSGIYLSASTETTSLTPYRIHPSWSVLLSVHHVAEVTIRRLHRMGDYNLSVSSVNRTVKYG